MYAPHNVDGKHIFSSSFYIYYQICPISDQMCQALSELMKDEIEDAEKRAEKRGEIRGERRGEKNGGIRNE